LEIDAMKLRQTFLLLLLTVLCSAVLYPRAASPPDTAQAPAAAAEKDDEELARLFREDQADRDVEDEKSIDWSVVGKRDAARLARVKELYGGNRLHSGADYFYAAMVLQHSAMAEDYLLAHELCVVAIGKGEERAKWLAAASEDRFLMNIGRPQRFGTQFRSKGPNTPWELYQVDAGVTDELRNAMDVPPLAKAKEREAAMNAKIKPQG
jgi:hypothetical protein